VVLDNKTIKTYRILKMAIDQQGINTLI